MKNNTKFKDRTYTIARLAHTNHKYVSYDYTKMHCINYADTAICPTSKMPKLAVNQTSK